MTRKQMLLETKTKMQLPRANIECRDIVSLVHYAWNMSFAHITSNKKAIAHRGWNPLTYNLLQDPELKETKSIMHMNYAT